jgi:hypothetical protein
MGQPTSADIGDSSKIDGPADVGSELLAKEQVWDEIGCPQEIWRWLELIIPWFYSVWSALEFSGVSGSVHMSETGFSHGFTPSGVCYNI